MSSTLDAGNPNMGDAVARYRYLAMTRMSKILGDGEGDAPQDSDEVVRDLSGLLLAGLEELRATEEELRTMNLALEAQRDGLETRLRHYQQLFAQAPAAVLVTDIFGTIAEANDEAGRLLRRAPEYLERKPLAAVIPPDDRLEFRSKLERCIEAGDVRDVCFSVQRLGDVPLKVSATVKLVPSIGATFSGMLYWLFATPTAQ